MNCVHHIAGRLRIKFPELKGQVHHARAVERAIRRLPGVRLAQVNAVTGSVLIHYDTYGTQQVALLDTIEDLVARRLTLPAMQKATSSSLPAQSNPVVERAVDLLLEKLVERAAFALLGALL